MHTESLDWGKLRILLNHWVQHNKEHSQEFREWAEKVKGFREIEVEGKKLILRTLFGEQKEIRANIKEIDFLNHNVILGNLG
jgi:predicted RNA-binding protein